MVTTTRLGIPPTPERPGSVTIYGRFTTQGILRKPKPRTRRKLISGAFVLKLMAQRPFQTVAFDGYPMPQAEKRIWIGDIFGPLSYTTGGYPFQSKSVGMVGVEWADFAGGSNSGNYYVSANYPGGSGNMEYRAVTARNLTVQWYYAANSVEVANGTDLSAEQTRALVWGI